MPRTAVVAGVGPGLGESIARRFHDEGCRVALLSRSTEHTESVAADLGERALAVAADVTDPDAVDAAFETVRDAFGSIDTLVFNASGGAWKGVRDISLGEFEHALDVSATGALCCVQAAIDDMLDGDGGTVIFTGATSAIRGRGGAAGFSAGKFAARGLAESMARELGPEGIHVAHTVIDGQIAPPSGADDPDSVLDPDAIADAYWDLVTQDRSAWTLELDLRPHVEDF